MGQSSVIGIFFGIASMAAIALVAIALDMPVRDAINQAPTERVLYIW
jgi:hypothetical protein